MPMTDFVRFLAAWALLHESADEGWKAAIARGRSQAPGDADGGPDAFVDGLAALVENEKERLKQELAQQGDRGHAMQREDATLAAQVDAMRFELAELRGRIESLQASIDALVAQRAD
jgi:small-conductance mechanosensitive channel